MKSGGTKCHFKWVKVPGTAPIGLGKIIIMCSKFTLGF